MKKNLKIIARDDVILLPLSTRWRRLNRTLVGRKSVRGTKGANSYSSGHTDTGVGVTERPHATHSECHRQLARRRRQTSFALVHEMLCSHAQHVFSYISLSIYLSYRVYSVVWRGVFFFFFQITSELNGYRELFCICKDVTTYQKS